MTVKRHCGENDGSRFLVSVTALEALEKEAKEEWGFNEHALIEAAGRSCARVFMEAFRHYFPNHKLAAAIGTGNNGADAMVMLRYWIVSGFLDPASAFLVVSRMPKKKDSGVWVELLASLKKLKVTVTEWDGDEGEAAGRRSDDIFANSDIIIDGISGTGIQGPLKGGAKEMAEAINFHRKKNNSSSHGNLIVSVDIPSGNSDDWKPGMTIVDADITLAIEPLKYCLYNPAARTHAGMILPVRGIFPPELIEQYGQAEILDWSKVRERISKVSPDAYKNQRGTVEIRAGSVGAAGAAHIASRGAQAAGAGLVRLVVDNEIYPILASQSTGIMVAPAEKTPGSSGFQDSRYKPDAILLGPGWGKTAERLPILEYALTQEKKGVPLILDADAIDLAKDKVFHGNVILTPHPGEMSSYCGIDKDELLKGPLPVLLKYAKERNAVILFKGHVITIAAPDGRVGIVDGMKAVLATGGSGDLLAGFCAAIAGRMKKEKNSFDAYTCAAAAAALLIASAGSKGFKARFTDPLELANRAADLAGKAWLKRELFHG